MLPSRFFLIYTRAQAEKWCYKREKKSAEGFFRERASRMRENQGADAATGPQPLMPRRQYTLSLSRGGCAAHNISLELLCSACCSDKALAFFFIVIIAAGGGAVRASAGLFFPLADEFLTLASFASRAIGGFIEH
jgi:hypothetical protein